MPGLAQNEPWERQADVAGLIRVTEGIPCAILGMAEQTLKVLDGFNFISSLAAKKLWMNTGNKRRVTGIGDFAHAAQPEQIARRVLELVVAKDHSEGAAAVLVVLLPRR